MTSFRRMIISQEIYKLPCNSFTVWLSTKSIIIELTVLMFNLSYHSLVVNVHQIDFPPRLLHWSFYREFRFNLRERSLSSLFGFVKIVFCLFALYDLWLNTCCLQLPDWVWQFCLARFRMFSVAGHEAEVYMTQQQLSNPTTNQTQLTFQRPKTNPILNPFTRVKYLSYKTPLTAKLLHYYSIHPKYNQI